MDQRMRGSRRRRPFHLESLENRNLLSTLDLGQTPASEVKKPSHSKHLKGTFKGIAAVHEDRAVFNSVTVDVPVEINGSGRLTHLGASQIYSTHTTQIAVDASGNPTGASVITGGQGYFTAANGDQLTFTYEGTGIANDMGGFTDTFTIVITGGTGRFENATGSGQARSVDLARTVEGFPFILTLDAQLAR